jgi:hypothetical protein
LLRLTTPRCSAFRASVSSIRLASLNSRTPPPLYLEIANNKAQPVYLSKTAFPPQTGVATYLVVTLPTGEPILGDPPEEIRAIAMPDTGKR